MDDMAAIVLAAGKGTRMHSECPKVLKKLLNEPMLAYVLLALEQSGFKENIWIVTGHESEKVRQTFPAYKYVLQSPQLGTGHALACALEEKPVAEKKFLLVLNGDAPLISAELIRNFIAEASESDLTFLTLRPDNIAQYGRVIRENGTPCRIMEARDFDEAQFPDYDGEVNAGIYLFRTAALAPMLERLDNNNKSGEYYLTDLVKLAFAAGYKISGICLGNDEHLLGINTPLELSCAEEILRRNIINDWFREGVLFHSPETVRCGPFVELTPGDEITGPCELYGNTRVGSNVQIQSHCVISGCLVQENAIIFPFSHMENAVVGKSAKIGPYARLRAGSVLESDTHVGNFVELKKTVLGKGAKANHLTYLGDATIGAETNIGAGTITCNYDGKNKFQTVIGEKAFIGSNTALVAPVKVGNDALVGAGSVITKDVPSGELAIARAKQQNLKKRRK